MKVLFVNACLRGEKSRTLQLCNAYLEELRSIRPDVQIEELHLMIDIGSRSSIIFIRRKPWLVL